VIVPTRISTASNASYVICSAISPLPPRCLTDGLG
jgi:hypothetical protein